MNEKNQKRHLWIIPAYGIFYLTAFSILEKRTVQERSIIQSGLDELIPFNELFIIPYFLWFAYIAATVIYFAFFCKSTSDYFHLIASLGIGMTLFLAVSFLWPNGHTLRPDTFERSNLFTDMVRLLYSIDTPTNIFPSIHVFNSVACCTAVLKNQELKKYRLLSGGTFILTVLIVLSTVFLKQHTVADVIAALLLNLACYLLVYKVPGLQPFPKTHSPQKSYTNL